LRLDLRISYTGMREEFLGSSGGGGGPRSHYNSGYHGPGFSRWTTISSFVVPFFQGGYYSYARDIM